MNTRPLAVTLLALTLATTGAAAQQHAAKAKEPVFQDRTLSEWVEDLHALAPYTRNKAAYAISGMGASAKAAVPALIEALHDPEAAVRYPVCVALREIGPDAKDAVPALKEALDDRNDDVAAMARRALMKITGEDPLDPGN